MSSTTENVFFQWPACNNCESLFPRAVVIHRICNVARMKFRTVNVPLPKPGEKFATELEARMLNLPYLETSGKKYRTSRQIWDYLIVSVDDTNIRNRLNKLDSIYSFIIQQWANESFINTLVYARWKRDENFERFSANVNWGPDATPESVAAVRKQVVKYLSRSPIGDMNEDEFRKLLVQQVSSLDSILETQRFFEAFAKFPSLSDLYVFMVIQGLLASDLEESDFIRDTYPNLIRWYNEVDALTAKDVISGITL